MKLSKTMEINFKETLNNYYSENPNASLSDFMTHIKNEDKNKNKRNKQKEDWYKTLVGRFFKKGEWLYFKVFFDEELNEILTEQYDVFLGADDNDCSIGKCDCAPFEKDWFNNPLDENEHRDTELVEITEEKFNIIVEAHNKIINDMKKLLAKI